MKGVEATLLAIPGVTEAQVFAKVLVRCDFPMSPDTMKALKFAHAQIEYETGWKVETTVSAGRCRFGMGAEPISAMDIVFRDMIRHGPRMTPDDDTEEKDSLHARVAAWEKEHPGKSFWDGAMADMEEDI